MDNKSCLKKGDYQMEQVTCVQGRTQMITYSDVQERGRFSTPIPKLATRIAPLAIACFALANIPGADAGPAAYAACYATCCVAFGTPIALTTAGTFVSAAFAACAKACLPLFVAPSP